MTLIEQPGKRNGALALVRAVREARIIPPLRKLIVFVLASYADADGSSICPSLKTVAELTGRDIRSVRRHIRALEADGVLVQTKPASRTRGAEFRLMRDALERGYWCPVSRSQTGHWCHRWHSETGHWCHPNRTPVPANLFLPEE